MKGMTMTTTRYRLVSEDGETQPICNSLPELKAQAIAMLEPGDYEPYNLTLLNGSDTFEDISLCIYALFGGWYCLYEVCPNEYLNRFDAAREMLHYYYDHECPDDHEGDDVSSSPTECYCDTDDWWIDAMRYSDTICVQGVNDDNCPYHSALGS